MRDHYSMYDYAIIRVIPRVEREEFVNVGVIVSCPARGFLEARIHLDEPRLMALDATLDLGYSAGPPGGHPHDLCWWRASRADWPTRTEGALPLARCTSEHDHPDIACAHWLLHKPNRCA